MFDTGAHFVRLTGGPIAFYGNYDVTALYVEKVFGGEVHTIVLCNDSDTDTVSISYDGVTVRAELLPRESLELNVSSITGVFFRGVAGGDTLRIWGW